MTDKLYQKEKNTSRSYSRKCSFFVIGLFSQPQGELMCRRHLFKSQGTDDYLLTAVVSILKNPKVSCIRKINSLFRCLRYCFQPFFTFYLFILSRIPLVTRHMFAEMLLHFTSFRSSFKEGCSKGSPPNIRTT